MERGYECSLQVFNVMERKGTVQIVIANSRTSNPYFHCPMHVLLIMSAWIKLLNQ